MARPGTWKPGQSGNPKGRPPKNRALTEIRAKQGCRTLEDFDGKRRSGKRVVARIMWELATTGKARLPDGRSLDVAPKDYLTIVKFVYSQVDGPPKAELDVTTGGGPFHVTLNWGEYEDNV